MFDMQQGVTRNLNVEIYETQYLLRNNYMITHTHDFTFHPLN